VACEEVGYNEFFTELGRRMGTQRAPLFGIIELTERCNLSCQHCYIHDPTRDRELRSNELTTEEWFRVFDELAEAGCLWMTWTGGEILLRSDFVDLYRYAKSKGFLIVLFTNGTLLTSELIALFQEWYPQYVEITLYGMTADTYEEVTGVRGSFERCMRGIEGLVAAGIPLRLKSVAMTLNQHELQAMYHYADSLGIQFRHDSVLRQTFHGKDISDLRLPPAQVAALDFVRPGAAEQMATAHELTVTAEETNPLYDPERLYNCGAGFRSFHVDPYGRLTGCHMIRSPSYELRTSTFRAGWEGFLQEFRATRISKDFACLHCDLVGLCQRCPAFSELENGDPESVVDYACAVAHLRARELGIVDRVRAFDGVVEGL
jgi:radical SAM protein with 4Fe4S-binding SPASM domain